MLKIRIFIFVIVVAALGLSAVSAQDNVDTVVIDGNVVKIRRNDVRRRRSEQQTGRLALESDLRVVLDDAPQIAEEALLEVPRVRVARTELERQRSPRNRHWLA